MSRGDAATASRERQGVALSGMDKAEIIAKR
jgi:hypothetical protein